MGFPFNPIKVIQTQFANATNREVPGLNTTQAQVNAQSGFKHGYAGGGGGGGGGGSSYTYGAPSAGGQVLSAANNGGGGGAPAFSGPSQQYTDALGVVHDTAGTAATSSAHSLQRSILDYISGLTDSQQARNQQTIQNYLAKQTGTQGVTDMVGQGIRSGGIMLSNKNAADSSAAQGIANAYGQLGRGQLGQIGNQFANAQGQVDLSQATDVRHLHEKEAQLPSSISDTVNGIVNSAQQQLTAIDSQMANLSLPDRVNMEAEKQRIKDEVMGKLQGFDTMLSSRGNAALTPIGQNEALQQAGQQFQAGRAPTTAFNFDQLPSAQFQNTGPFASGLPIFTFPGTKKQTA